MVSLRYCRLGGISPQATSIVVVKRMLISPIVFILYSKLSNGLAPNVCVYAGCGFRSHDKSPWVNEVTKTKLQTNMQTRSLHKHAVAGSGASTPNLFCKQPVHRYGLSFTVRFAFIISYHNSSTCLFSVARRPVSPVTKNFLKIKSATCPRCRKVVGLLRTFHGDEHFKKKVNRHLGQYFTTICQR